MAALKVVKTWGEHTYVKKVEQASRLLVLLQTSTKERSISILISILDAAYAQGVESGKAGKK